MGCVECLRRCEVTTDTGIAAPHLCPRCVFWIREVEQMYGRACMEILYYNGIAYFVDPREVAQGIGMQYHIRRFDGTLSIDTNRLRVVGALMKGAFRPSDNVIITRGVR